MKKNNLKNDYLDLLSNFNKESYGKTTYMSFKPINYITKRQPIFYYSVIFWENNILDLNNSYLNFKSLSLEQRLGVINFNLIIFGLDSTNLKKDNNINKDQSSFKKFKGRDN